MNNNDKIENFKLNLQKFVIFCMHIWTLSARWKLWLNLSILKNLQIKKWSRIPASTYEYCHMSKPKDHWRLTGYPAHTNGSPHFFFMENFIKFSIINEVAHSKRVQGNFNILLFIIIIIFLLFIIILIICYL
jgi:hypothetical protein